MMLDMLLWPVWGYWQYRREQKELWSLYRQGHDIGFLPGDYLIHYSTCQCKVN